MFKKILIASLFLIKVFHAEGQPLQDTARPLSPVVINAYFGNQPALTMPSSVSVLGRTELRAQQAHSLLPAINSVPGVRLEERSPGSYRLSVRGSMLRSPYGIRNVKIYMDDFILTDAGGNTYLGSVDPEGIGGLEILKGPEGSVFGANTGGVILIRTDPGNADSSLISGGITGGSYGLFYQKASFLTKGKNAAISISEAWQRSDGYRENSAMRRNYIQVAPSWSYARNARVKALILYSDMNYRTPGGLTEAQLRENPQAARPATAVTPGASEQKAGILNRTLLTGLSHEYKFSPRLRSVTAVTYSNTDFRNPFITNYEMRDENSISIRTYLDLRSNNLSSLPWQVQAGFEGQQTKADISNYGNRRGIRDTMQASDKMKTNQGFFFLHFSAQPLPALLIEMAGSVNYYNYRYANVAPVTSGWMKRSFSEQIMPRAAVSYLFTPNIALRLSASRGYSPPTIAEVRASDNMINTSLGAESGWSYEAGVRLSLFQNRIYWDVAAFNFNMKDAIVRQLNQSGNEFFQKAGGIRQNGIESQLLSWIKTPHQYGFLRGLRLSNSYTLSSFYFQKYVSGEKDYSGNRLTGVPRHIIVTSLNFTFPAGISLNGQHNYTTRAPLNDAGSIYSKEYHLVRAKLSWNPKRKGKVSAVLFSGVDNLLNKRYSLGNDLNAFGSRFFNPAPARNFFAGLDMTF